MVKCCCWEKFTTRIRNRLCIGLHDEENKGIGLVDLCDDCWLEILSRLPSYDVLRCRIVCKRWHTLTSSAHFIAIQTKRAPTIIILHELTNKRNQRAEGGWSYNTAVAPYIDSNLFCLDDTKTNKKLKKLTLNKTSFTKHEPELLFSFGGLVVFKGYCRFSPIFFVLNPISGKSTHVPWPPQPYWNTAHCLCGLFFHPLASEFNFLFVHVMEDYLSCWYYVYGSASNSWRKINSTPLLFRPTYRYDPVIVEMCLHWMVNFEPRMPRDESVCPCKHAIMIFNINSEEIYTMPHPMINGQRCHVNNFLNNHEMMVLFEMEKKLWLAHIFRQGGSGMVIWELNDHVNWSWVKRYNICENEVPKRLPIHCWRGDLYTRRTKILCINKGILFINWYSSELYLLDLTLKTINKIPDKYTSSNNTGLYFCTTYTCSLLMPNV
ncbi:hypothetical protein LIER_28450 [Lithospermum erythrorhizon]|uniref:F-box domain-containing protein n=1 Tax=Lithospermum erythrorhizon TaxID=34254 RepID=A0AAV3RJ47_LITER